MGFLGISIRTDLPMARVNEQYAASSLQRHAETYVYMIVAT